MKEILDIKQLSTYLQVSISEIRKLVRQKNIPYFRIGNRLKFDLANINLWIEELEEKKKNIIILGTNLLICDIIHEDD